MGYRWIGAEYFRAMPIGAARPWAARLLLWVLVCASLPRSTFHECDHAEHAAHEAGARVGPNDHCAICEAPVPCMDGEVAASVGHLARVELSLRTVAVSSRPCPLAKGRAVRGPPSTV